MRKQKRWWTPAERVEAWGRYKAGESLASIGRVLGRESATVFRQMRASGGVTPPRHRALRVLRLTEREDISRGLVCSFSAFRTKG